MHHTAASLLLISLLSACAAAPDTVILPGAVQATLSPAQAVLSDAQGSQLVVAFAALGRDEADSWQEMTAVAPRWGGCAHEAEEDDGSCARQLRYDRSPNVTEWWVPRGDRVQQGWTLDAPHPGTGPLRLEVRFPEATRLQVTPATAHITPTSGHRWRYDQLLAWDAQGAPLAIWLEPAGPQHLHVVVDDTDATYPITIDPIAQPESAIFSATDAVLGDAFGTSLSSAGDINGDGYEDLLVGAPNHLVQLGEKGVSADTLGAAYVYYGSSSGLDITQEQKLSAPFGQGFGSTVAAAGDLNNDGYDDIIIGGAIEAFPEEKKEKGKKEKEEGKKEEEPVGRSAVYIYYGSADGIDEGSMQTLMQSSDTGFGVTVAGLGDVDGDGYDDVIVGAPDTIITVEVEPEKKKKGKGKGKGKEEPTTEDISVGAVHLYFGSSLGVTEGAGWQLLASEPEEYSSYGASVSAAGDVDGDGYRDILVGVPSYNGDSFNTGAAYVYYGASTGIDTDREDMLFDESDFYYYDEVGLSVAGAVDVDGDGYDDVVLGSNDDTAYVYHGGAGGITLEIGAELESGGTSPEGDGFGEVVGGLGDVDGDGYEDVLFGTPEDGDSEEGAAYFFRGSSGGLTTEAGVRFTMSGRGAYDNFGAAVAALDVNNDGFQDVVVSAPNDVEGTIHIFLGEADQDGDGLGASADCNDTDAGVTGPVTLYADEDEDGYGNLFAAASLCPPQAGYVDNNDDCNDEDPEIHPGIEEICEDGTDQDCDGEEDACPEENPDPGEGGGDGGGEKGCAVVTGRPAMVGGAGWVLAGLGLLWASSRRRRLSA